MRTSLFVLTVAFTVALIGADGTAVRAQSRPPQAAQAVSAPRVYGDAGAAFALGLSIETPWYLDGSYDVFADDDVALRLGLWVGYDVASLSDELIAAVELGWGHETDEAHVLGVASSELSAHVVHAGATVRWVPIDWLQPQLRLAAGTAIVDTRLIAGDTFHDGAEGVFEDLIAPFASAGLGVLLRSPTRAFENQRGRHASLSFGLLVEGGYSLAAPVDVELAGPKPSARGIPIAEPALGELDRSGPYIRVSLVGRL
jgi:hypothetical protein